MTATTTIATCETFTYVAKGLTDDVTTCDHCGREDLKNTVRMVIVGPDGDEDGEMYMGVTCAAKMSGRKATEIRTEAARADRAREQAIRDTHRAWSDARSSWYCAKRDAELGPNAKFPAIVAWDRTPEFKATEAIWLVANPEPTRPWA